MSTSKKVYLAGGCFWGVAEYYSRIPGVYSAICGYANGALENPSYEEVCKGQTGHAETVCVTYDPEVIGLKTLVEQLFKIINPLSLNHQGGDFGTQYRTGVYYVEKGDLEIIRAVFEQEQKKYDEPLAVELLPLARFFKAEEYHQDYLKKNPYGYCHISFDSLQDVKTEQELARENPEVDDSPGSLNSSNYSKPEKEQIADILTREQYSITQHGSTERPSSGEYYRFFERGLYVDIVTGEPLFTSTDKYESDCGWPAFSKPVDPVVVKERVDVGFGMIRTEVRSRVGNSHLGHVFTDGPERLGGLRYCINSAALKFIPYDEMEASGYGDLMHLCK